MADSADSARVQRLKDLVLVRELRAMLTSGEFALRLRGAAQLPGLVDYEGLCRRLGHLQERLERQPPSPLVLPKDDAWKAVADLQQTRELLEERLVEMTYRQEAPVVPRSGASARRQPDEQEEPDGHGDTGDDAEAPSNGSAIPAGVDADAVAEQSSSAVAAEESASPAEVEEVGAGEADAPKAGKDEGRSWWGTRAGSATRDRFLLYLREDSTCDVDSTLKESIATAPFSRDLQERIQGVSGKQPEDEWSSQGTRMALVVPLRVGDKRQLLVRERRELANAQAMRDGVLRRIREEEFEHRYTGGHLAAAATPTRLTAELFRCDRAIECHQLFALLASVDLLFERVAAALEAALERCGPAEWDMTGRHLKLLVFEFSLLEKQVVPYQRYVQEAPEALRGGSLDADELQLLREHVTSIADRLGLSVEDSAEGDEGREGDTFGLRRRWAQACVAMGNVRRGVSFYGNGARLLFQDISHAARLVLKLIFLHYSLTSTEVQVCMRAVKDIVVSLPFLVLLLLPLTPPGHVLVFSLIAKVYPDFFPSPFTERRQNVMRIYNDIKPASDRRGAWAS